ncbi:phospholipase [candidate division KSB1 bacterium]|nr:phospholipase [candidate division KSB1 bacterium]
MQEHHLTVSRTARYFLLGTPCDAIRQVWFVCHGYGHSASTFLEKFEPLDDGHRLIVAPEGLSRFYWQGFSGKVGASWMTKEDRLNEIKDYVGYLEALYRQICKQIERAKVELFVLGFSQGTATVCRWVQQGAVECDKLILWAGLMPPDIDLKQNKKRFQQLKLTLVVGNRDELAKPTVITEQESRLKQNDIPYRLLRFDGGHEIHDETLKEIAAF